MNEVEELLRYYQGRTTIDAWVEVEQPVYFAKKEHRAVLVVMKCHAYRRRRATRYSDPRPPRLDRHLDVVEFTATNARDLQHKVSRFLGHPAVRFLNPGNLARELPRYETLTDDLRDGSAIIYGRWQ